jgi:hypothetical protein
MINSVKSKQKDRVTEDIEHLRDDIDIKMKPFLDDFDAAGLREERHASLKKERELGSQQQQQRRSAELLPAAPAVADDRNFEFDSNFDWEREEEILNRQALETKREMAKLTARRNQIRFAKKREEMKANYTKHLHEVKHVTERELQTRVSGLRAEGSERMREVDSFKSELKERIDALCRCYEEVSVRGVQMENAFKEAEDRLVDEAKKSILVEKERCEAELRREVADCAKQLDIGLSPPV